MNDLAAWKPVLSALALPPTPALLLALIGARVTAGRRRGLGVLIVFISVALLWLGSCTVTARWLQGHVVKPPPALSATELARLSRLGSDRRQTATAIVVLGGGRRSDAAEFADRADLTPKSLMRLRYGVWLARKTGLPLAFSGGVGWAQTGEAPEAAVAARIAQEEWGLPLRWQEPRSRDTRENAAFTVPILQASGVREIVLVTDANHMPRALRAFREAAARASADLQLVPAPVAFIEPEDRPVLDWLPSARGYQGVHDTTHEWLGRVMGH